MIERYTNPEMGNIWTLQHEFEVMLDVEIAACEAMAELGEIPKEAAVNIREKAQFDLPRVKEIEKETNHDIIAFLTNVASLGIDAIYHHLYDFGTTGLFLAMGKKKRDFIYDDETIKEEKCISLAFVCDERICDGYYFASSVKMFNRFLKKPELLEENVEKVEDIK